MPSPPETPRKRTRPSNRQFRFGGIEKLEDMPRGRHRGEARDLRRISSSGGQEIAEQHDGRMARHRGRGRRRFATRLVEQASPCGREPGGRWRDAAARPAAGPARRRAAAARRAPAAAARRARLLGEIDARATASAWPGHRHATGRPSAPPPIRSRARTVRSDLRGLPPVDARRSGRPARTAELPEAVALADAAAAMHALRHRRGDTLGRHQQRRQARAERLGARFVRAAIPTARTPLQPMPRRPAGRSPRPASTPSARAEKFSAMRWRSTGRRQRRDIVEARATSRPSSSARARHASISACAARGPGPQATCRRTSSWSAVSGRAAAHQAQDRVDHLLAHRHAADQRLRADQIVRPSAPARRGFRRAPVVASSMRRSASRSG